MHLIHKTNTLITWNQSSYLQLLSFSSSSHSTQAHEKSHLAYFRRFKRQFTRISVYKVLYYLTIKVKSLDPMIPSKELHAYGKWEGLNSPQDFKMLFLLNSFSPAPEEIFFWLAVTKPVVLTSPLTIHRKKSAASSLTWLSTYIRDTRMAAYLSTDKGKATWIMHK